MWDAEAGIGIVLIALADLATEAEVAGGIVWVERNVLRGVKEVSAVPRCGEITVIFVEAEQCVGRWLLVRRRLRRVLRQDRLAWIDWWRQQGRWCTVRHRRGHVQQQTAKDNRLTTL